MEEKKDMLTLLKEYIASTPKEQVQAEWDEVVAIFPSLPDTGKTGWVEEAAREYALEGTAIGFKVNKEKQEAFQAGYNYDQSKPVRSARLEERRKSISQEVKDKVDAQCEDLSKPEPEVQWQYKVHNLTTNEDHWIDITTEDVEQFRKNYTVRVKPEPMGGKTLQEAGLLNRKELIRLIRAEPINEVRVMEMVDAMLRNASQPQWRETEKELPELRSEIKNAKGYENLVEILGEKLGSKLYELVNYGE